MQHADSCGGNDVLWQPPPSGLQEGCSPGEQLKTGMGVGGSGVMWQGGRPELYIGTLLTGALAFRNAIGEQERPTCTHS